MNDLFSFLKDLIRGEPEVLAAFVMGFVVAAAFLAYAIYWFLSSYYSKKMTDLEADLKDAKLAVAEGRSQLKEVQHEQADLKKEVKEKDQENRLLNAKVAAAEQTDKGSREHLTQLQKQIGEKDARSRELVVTYNELVRKHNHLIGMARSLKKQATSLNAQAKLVEKVQGQLWDVPVDPAHLTPFRPLAKKSAVIIAVINLKGGVGKTTLTANLAVTFCRQEKRVLVVDLDFQASLTNLCLPADRVAELAFGAGRLVDNLFKDWSAGVAQRAFSNLTPTREPKLHILANSEKLAKIEEEAKARWILSHDGFDLRCVLRTALHDPVFQNHFDVILIDCPPRWTTGSINTIACCDYVLIPTQLDRVSCEAVPRLLGWLRDLRRDAPELYGHFDILGVIGNLAFPREKLVAHEQSIWEELPAKCRATWFAPVYHFATILRDKSDFRRAANNREFAALNPNLQPAFVSLIEEIEARRAAHEA